MDKIYPNAIIEVGSFTRQREKERAKRSRINYLPVGSVAICHKLLSTSSPDVCRSDLRKHLAVNNRYCIRDTRRQH